VLALFIKASAFAPIHGGAAARALGGRHLGRISPATRPSTARLAAPETAVLGGIDDSAWQRPASKGKREVVIGTKINTVTPVVTTKPDPGCELGAYMSLPPEQYVLIPLPNNAKLERINGGNFRLKVRCRHPLTPRCRRGIGKTSQWLASHAPTQHCPGVFAAGT